MVDASVPDSRSGNAFARVAGRMRRRVDPAIASAFGCIVVVLFVGSLYSTSFLSPEYLLQQLKVASFLGIIATGMMIVILLIWMTGVIVGPEDGA
jgi:ribose/xylose/arabinose/galactoside ABC-type transport system permease subunit